MTQKQMEDKIREIKFVYGERAQELVKMHKPAVDEVEQKIEEAKINRDKELMTFHERLNKLNDQEYELRRMGHNDLSPELDECRRKKNALKQEKQQAHIQCATQCTH